jgi:hypothetical protein
LSAGLLKIKHLSWKLRKFKILIFKKVYSTSQSKITSCSHEKYSQSSQSRAYSQLKCNTDISHPSPESSLLIKNSFVFPDYSTLFLLVAFHASHPSRHKTMKFLARITFHFLSSSSEEGRKGRRRL